MTDLLVKLYALPEVFLGDSQGKDYRIIRAMTPDKEEVIGWVREHSGKNAVGECEKAFANSPVSIYIAERYGEILGYACYDATALGFFGPTRVDDSFQGRGIGRELLLACLKDMRKKGYGYAIIGGAGPVEFYEKTVRATVIEGSDPGIYKDFLPIIRKRGE